MAILETERVSHNPIEVLQADSCTCAGKKSRPRTLSFREDEEKLRPGQLNATLTLTCMLHAQSIWQSWRLNGFLTTQEVLQADSCTCAGKKSRPRTLSFREDEEKLRPGQLNATLTLTCMLHAQSIWQSWRLNGFLTTQEVLQADSCTCAEKKQAKNTFFQRR